ncbi:acyl-ACP thioesterase [Fibrobacterales bacterium]|nr:acyl-ACP thioesterase [Fibrobacterales bacterium]
MLSSPKKFSVQFFDCDSSAHLRISRLSEFFQEASLSHLEEQGFDYQTMINRDKFTLLISRVKIRLTHLPLWGENITITTWLKGFAPDKVGWNDYDVRDSQGNSIVQATSSWLLINLNDGKAMPFKDGPYKFEISDKSAMPETIDILEPKGMPTEVLVKSVRYSDIDLNNHVNNCRYTDWVLDTLSPEEIRERRIRSIQLNYLQQVPYNAKVSLMRFPPSRHHIDVFGVNKDHPEEVHFQARIGFDKALS